MTAHLGLPYFLFFREQYFHFILEVLTTEKRAHAGPIFIFPWTVLPFYFGSTNHGKMQFSDLGK